MTYFEDLDFRVLLNFGEERLGFFGEDFFEGVKEAKNLEIRGAGCLGMEHFIIFPQQIDLTNRSISEGGICGVKGGEDGYFFFLLS